jgi:hypothetical protein
MQEQVARRCAWACLQLACLPLLLHCAGLCLTSTPALRGLQRGADAPWECGRRCPLRSGQTPWEGGWGGDRGDKARTVLTERQSCRRCSLATAYPQRCCVCSERARQCVHRPLTAPARCSPLWGAGPPSLKPAEPAEGRSPRGAEAGTRGPSQGPSPTHLQAGTAFRLVLPAELRRSRLSSVVLARGPQAGARTQARPGPGGKSDDSFFNSFIKGDLPQRIGTVLVRPPGGCGCARRDRPAPTASCSRARTRESLRGERDQGGLCCPRVAPYIRSSQAGSGALAACWRR